MNLLVDRLLHDTTAVSLPGFLPELLLCATIVVLLLAKVLPLLSRVDPLVWAFGGLAAAAMAAIPQQGLSEVHRTELFTGMLVIDPMAAYLRVLLLGFGVLLLLLTKLTGLADRSSGQDFYVLVVGALLGMCLMVEANHLLIVFLAVEMASVPSYVLAGVEKGRPRAGEAALKYAVFGAGASGVMLYGISLIAGLLGTAHLPTLASRLAEMNTAASASPQAPTLVLMLAAVMIMVGLAFKLSAVPFHFWCPDVFEGAPAEIGALLSVASKTAALALLVRVAMIATPTAPIDRVVADPPAAVQVAAATPAAVPTPAGFVALLIGSLAIATCTFGNLAAYAQTSLKRMLAYSTIAHAGYMMMPVAAAVAVAGAQPATAELAIAALLLYAGVYLFMNLGAFAIAALVERSTGSDQIDDYAGLIRSSPVTAVALAVVLFSLLGMPPLAGFFAKFAAFRALALVWSPLSITMLAVAAVNTAISLVYYLRVARVATMHDEPDTRGPVQLGMLSVIYVAAVTLPLVLLGLFPGGLADAAQQAARGLWP
ncbi:NADH-quinone oxidoreductase subunit N [Pirellulimonas nuda]|uniref:NADH-quinone oxidoreductase subunit N n=1 Tax=Pirellulimonas nuda TaxID=2528009 RepID=A0A518DGE4_9BACT|nr:NADH-quinone oxidoreductase subunit N [Pirellulimonas nuda]QDU90553.1 NADH-quinone oxidoreductase subunit N [Pirellulimonas nuda]